MSPGDHVPDDDAIARGARHALYRIAYDHRIDTSWTAVQKAARRAQQKRLSVFGAAGALVLVSATAAVAATANHPGRPVRVIGSEPTETTVSDTTSSMEPYLYDSSSVPTTTGEGPISDGIPPATNPDETDTTVPPPLQPQDGSWRASMSVDATETEVGGYVTVHADLRNTGTEPQQTNGYASLAIVCARWPSSEAADGWPVGQFVDPAIIDPGESQSFSMTFWTDTQQVGNASCSVGLSYDKDAWWASPFPGLESDSVPIEIIAAAEPPPSTSTTTTVPTTATTVP